MFLRLIRGNLFRLLDLLHVWNLEFGYFRLQEEMREIPLQNYTSLQFPFSVLLYSVCFVFALRSKISNNTISTGFFVIELFCCFVVTISDFVSL